MTDVTALIASVRKGLRRLSWNVADRWEGLEALDALAAAVKAQAERIGELERRNEWLKSRASGSLLMKLEKEMKVTP